jgi:uncharacterized protein (TIGR03067 family)
MDSRNPFATIRPGKNGDAIMRQVSGMICAALSLVLLGCGSKQGGGQQTSSGDPRLEGSYTLIETEMKGIRSKETEKDRIYTFSGDKLILPKGKPEEADTVKCDPNVNPHEITISKTESSGKVDTTYGIYKIEGDILTIGMIKSDNPANRPKEFKTGKGSNEMILVLQKNK